MSFEIILTGICSIFIGVSRQTISSLENGRYNPSIVLAFKIAKYFDLTIEEVFIYEE
ncbi:MAG TPA: helix-turn-helix transcriptional regulator [Candidatus Jeotgalibaca pullicola]|uniref:Transcriptional regulator n=1 Tax=Jeotgalibaca ciconiae TaxID=2496265 RepID=A0A3Q9BMI8_9LACT|nr:helix-turn-helix transcriptional regulator [Jeotgalibaca ciconiae]AZP05631.1 transcriptional regulator [Jeotgalibaca ciconiae]HJB23150.1 helix-turn-helix transcriptional regulator [Candidatus Jeotgalibaca pullicola]